MWLAQIIETIVRRRRFVILNTLVFTIVAVIVSLLLPKHYRATATVLPPDQETPLGGLMGFSIGHIAQAVTNFSLPIMATPSDLYASIIKSDTILIQVVDKFDLRTIYDAPTRWKALAELRSDLVVKVEAEGIIKIEVESSKPELAAGIANAIVENLDSFNRELQQQKGRAYSEFLELRLAETDSSIQAASDQLRSFQNKFHAVSLDLQADALIKTLAEQKGKLTSSEIELEILRKTLYSDHPTVIAKQMEVSETRRRLLEIESGARTKADSVISALDIPLMAIPDLSLQYAVLIRNLKIQEVTYEMLSQQFEMYRLQAERDTPTISTLDRARPPEQASRPRKKIIVITVFLMVLIISSAYTVFRENPLLISGLDEKSRSQFSKVWSEFKRRPLG